FDFQDPNTGTPASVGDTASVSYAEPALSISKVANPATDVAIAEPVTYTLTVSNAAGRPAAHDAVVVDTVPAGLIVDTGTFQIDGVDATPSQVTFDPGVETGAGGEVSWTVGAVGAGGAIELSYVASIDP